MIRRREFLAFLTAAPAAALIVPTGKADVIFVDGHTPRRLFGNSGRTQYDACRTLEAGFARVRQGGQLFISNLDFPSGSVFDFTQVKGHFVGCSFSTAAFTGTAHIEASMIRGESQRGDSDA